MQKRRYPTATFLKEAYGDSKAAAALEDVAVSHALQVAIEQKDYKQILIWIEGAVSDQYKEARILPELPIITRSDAAPIMKILDELKIYAESEYPIIK